MRICSPMYRGIIVSLLLFSCRTSQDLSKSQNLVSDDMVDTWETKILRGDEERQNRFVLCVDLVANNCFDFFVKRNGGGSYYFDVQDDFLKKSLKKVKTIKSKKLSDTKFPYCSYRLKDDRIYFYNNFFRIACTIVHSILSEGMTDSEKKREASSAEKSINREYQEYIDILEGLLNKDTKVTTTIEELNRFVQRSEDLLEGKAYVVSKKMKDFIDSKMKQALKK